MLDHPPPTIPGLFAAAVAAGPGRTAVTCGADHLSYAALDRRSAALAGALHEAGVRPGDRVGVSLAPSVDLVVALLAVLRTGAAYVPLDPAHPARRLAAVAADTAIGALVTDGGALPDFPGPRLSPRQEPAAEAAPVPAGPEPDAVAYVIHTSGSTGRPKGVLIPHRNVAALLAATADTFGFGPDDVWTQFHSFAFDFSVWEIWGALLTGGRLVLVPHWTARDPAEFRRLLVREGVTVLSQTPSACSQLLALPDSGTAALPVRLLVLGGEPLDPRLLRPWFDRNPRCRVENMYGITETTVHVTRRTVTAADAEHGGRSVGRALPGWELHVLDERGAPVPPGRTGEIHVGGAGLADGYLGRPELTAERFVTDRPLGAVPRRLYRSGDLGRFTPDGELEHLGRIDDQVQIRGHRVEPGEIRAALMEHPDVRAAAVVIREAADPARTRVDAYAVGPAGPDPGPELRDFLATRLPAPMLPATVRVLDRLPLTPNGKVDTDALPVPGPVRPGAPADAPDTDPLLDRLAGVWRQVLGVEVGPEDNFFTSGGNSLLVARLRTAMNQAGLGAPALRDLYRNSSLTAMAELVRDRAR